MTAPQAGDSDQQRNVGEKGAMRWHQEQCPSCGRQVGYDLTDFGLVVLNGLWRRVHPGECMSRVNGYLQAGEPRLPFYAPTTPDIDLRRTHLRAEWFTDADENTHSRIIDAGGGVAFCDFDHEPWPCSSSAPEGDFGPAAEFIDCEGCGFKYEEDGEVVHHDPDCPSTAGQSGRSNP